MMNSLNDGFRALVIGSTGTIGAAFVAALENDSRCEGVHTLSRQSKPAIDLGNEASMAAAALALQTHAPFHLIVDATGALTIDGVGPEKSLAALSEARLLRSFQINAIGPALLLKHLSPLLATSGRTIYAKLSARVGSIGDNSKGGWYGYRASKAALNMLLQTAAIEAARRRPELVVAALQPGTVASALTSPFVDPSHCITPEQSVAGMLGALDGLPAKSGAHFVDYAGNSIEW
jgi:NAD(P)-dependent dehydrogenase (short-subunit alcohol dehydrogenase family)